ncbi:MAG: alpha-amylase family glycosyl hydrolase [Myxococcales bacterium]|nr:alpha-amylase family glycosyl hydrolase [Myxococcales bacterium]
MLQALLVGLAGCAGDARGAAVRTHVRDWRDQIVYQIVVDRFADGLAVPGEVTVPGDLRRWQGGDWRGIRENLDALRALGVTAIWISPVVRNAFDASGEDAYHGYWPSDWTEAEPRFGGEAELRALVDAAHAEGMLVLIDVVVNHAGPVFDYDLNADGRVEPHEVEPPFRADGPQPGTVVWRGARPRLWRPDGTVLELGEEHFHRRGRARLDDPVERVLGDFPHGLRDLATEREDVFEALVETTARWIERTDADGLRLDAVPHVEPAFWFRFATALRERLAAVGKERVLLVGEVFSYDPAELGRYTGPGALDAAIDVPGWRALFVDVLLGGGSPAAARRAIEAARAMARAEPQAGGAGVDAWHGRFVFAESHDVPRIRALLDDPFAVDLAMGALLALDGIPCLYYGTERDLRGHEAARLAQHASREPLWWAPARRESPTFVRIARLAALRRGSVALRRGTLRFVHAAEAGGRDLEATDAGLLAWERTATGQTVLVVLNAHDRRSSSARIRTSFEPGSRLRDLLDPHAPLVHVDRDGFVVVDRPPRSVAWLAP